MDLSSLKNIDVNDLVSKLKNSEFLQDKKTLTKFGIGFVSILIFLIVYYFFVSLWSSKYVLQYKGRNDFII